MDSLLRATLLLFISALSAWTLPQDSPPPGGPYEIRGLVLDAKRQPVSGAEVVASPEKDSSPSAKAVTDAEGAFTMSIEQPGRYRMWASYPGDPPAPGTAAASQSFVDLEARYRVAEITLSVSRVGALSGRVVDEEGKPLGNWPVTAVRGSGMRASVKVGMFLTAAGFETEGRTDPEGRVAFSSLPPGNYSLMISPQDQGKRSALTTFDPDEAAKVDSDYERSYWPGGLGPESARPVVVSPGMTADVGTVVARKTQYFRVLVRLSGVECEPGDQIRFMSERIVGSGSGDTVTDQFSESFRCANPTLLTGYPQGSYRLTVRHDNGAIGTTTFSVGGKNAGIVVALRARVRVRGSVIPADGARPPDFENLTLTLRRTDGGLANSTVVVSEDGSFELDAVEPFENSVVLRLPATHYVKEIRFNGAVLASPAILPFDQGVTDCVLTVVAGDDPAAITGTVASPGRSSGPFHLLAAKWPFDLSAIRAQQLRTAGPFRIDGLAPGEYRVVALSGLPLEPVPGLPTAALLAHPSFSAASVLERVLNGGAKVELQAGGTANVSLTSRDLIPSTR